MYVTGNISAIDEKSARVKIDIPEFDNITSGWFFIPQLCTVKDKSYNTIAINTLVAACCTDDLQDGCILGALYNDEDICVLGDENKKYIFFEDGAKFCYDKQTHEFTVIAEKTVIQTDLTVIGNINCTQNVSDCVGTMATIRQKHNAHVHGNGNNGGNTTAPTEKM